MSALSFSFLLLSAWMFCAVSGHVYVKSWKTTSVNSWQAGQKSWKLSDTAYRPASDNIGWVGSKFLTTNKAIVCGASNTPKGRVAPSGGHFFSDSAYSAGQTLKVNAGGKVSLLLQGDTGRGYPHHVGNIQAYLGKCGDSPSACQSFDASTANFFKIQERQNGVTQLHKQYSKEMGGDIWDVDIPAWVPKGSYIFRFEIITWGESVAAEGFQDQYYPSCGQLYVMSNKSGDLPKNIPTLRLPGGYQNGNIKPSSMPGPPLALMKHRRMDSKGPSKRKEHKHSRHNE